MPTFEEVMKDKKFLGSATDGILRLYNAAEAQYGQRVAKTMLQGKMIRIYEEYLVLRRMDPGIDRAKHVHRRISAIIEGKFKNDPDAKRVACTNCKIIGSCCHVQTDITRDEAKLLAEKVREGAEINLERMELQATIEDDPFDWGRTEKWGKLSYEERSCIFLDITTGKCNVYDDRPSACRNWFIAEENHECGNIKESGMTYMVHVAEILASAALNANGLDNGRIPKLLKQELKK